MHLESPFSLLFLFCLSQFYVCVCLETSFRQQFHFCGREGNLVSAAPSKSDGWWEGDCIHEVGPKEPSPVCLCKGASEEPAHLLALGPLGTCPLAPAENRSQ